LTESAIASFRSMIENAGSPCWQLVPAHSGDVPGGLVRAHVGALDERGDHVAAQGVRELGLVARGRAEAAPPLHPVRSAGHELHQRPLRHPGPDLLLQPLRRRTLPQLSAEDPGVELRPFARPGEADLRQVGGQQRLHVLPRKQLLGPVGVLLRPDHRHVLDT
jgi:hypothetical protein